MTKFSGFAILSSFIVLVLIQFLGLTLVTAIGFGITFGMTWVLAHRFVISRLLFNVHYDELSTLVSLLVLQISYISTLGFTVLFNEYYAQLFESDLLKFVVTVGVIGLGLYLGYRLGLTVAVSSEKSKILRIFFVILTISIVGVSLIFADSLETLIFIISMIVTAMLIHLRYHANQDEINPRLTYFISVTFLAHIITLAFISSHFRVFNII